MLQTETSKLSQILLENQNDLIDKWVEEQKIVMKRESETTLRKNCSEFLQLFLQAITANSDHNSKKMELNSVTWSNTKAFLNELSATKAREGYSSSEIATFIFSFKKEVFKLLSRALLKQPEQIASEIQLSSETIDQLGLYTIEVYQKTRERLIESQRKDLLELSTPVIQLWQGIIALPLIGALDSNRSQIMMERLLEVLANTGASVAILDISGVPTIDTLVAQHLLKTIQAAKIMGAYCIISGIRPETAQTIVHLGIDLSSVRTKSTMARALEEALALQSFKVVAQNPSEAS